ncbi:MAG: hypothetical protein AB1Z38_09945 [Desulfotignum sp.]
MTKPEGHLDCSGLKTYSIRDRNSLVSSKDFARSWDRGNAFKSFLDTLPAILAGNDIRAVIHAITTAARNCHPVCFAMGGHVIKTGMAPVIIDLIEKKVITLVAMNGAGIIHDLEVALAGHTSEDVAGSLENGSFGMARETADCLNQAIARAKKEHTGLGRAVGQFILDQDMPYQHLSLLAAGARLTLPVTVHVALGTDILHMHPRFDAAACGQASMHDFHTFAAQIARLENGVFINAGSAVILPEVFLKALTLARNLGHPVDHFTTVNLDFIRHYRPLTNVVNRPTRGKGQGFSLVGHHELLIPLIAAGIIESL